MADQTITPVECTLTGEDEDDFIDVDAAYASLTLANDGLLAPPADGTYLLHCKVTAGDATQFVIEAEVADHEYGPLGGRGDMTSAVVANGSEVILAIESARFKALAGTDVGKVRISLVGASATASVAAFALP